MTSRMIAEDGWRVVGIRRWTDLTLVTILAIGGTLLAALDLPVPVVRAVVGVPFALVLPGYAILAALFARSSLRPVEWALGSVAGSVLIAVVGGFVLNWLPWGLRPQTWAFWLGGITLAATVAAGARRADGAFTLTRPDLPRVHSRGSVLLGLAALVLVASVGIAVYGASHMAHPGFTQLWLLPAPGGNARIGIRNEEGKPFAYSVRVQADGIPVQTWPDVDLQPGETWEMVLGLTPQQQRAQTIEALVSAANAPGTVYRRATLER